MVRKKSDKRQKKWAEQFSGGAQMEARKGAISYVPRTAAVEKLGSVYGEVKKMIKDHYSSLKSLQLTQKQLERVRSEFKETEVLIER